MAFLLQSGVYTDAPRPNLVLLDLNMPRKSGFDVREDIRATPHLSDITVFVFSTSTRQNDRERSVQLGADSYLTKGDYDSFVRAVDSVCKKLSGFDD
jgi:two-component system response regulator